jgi:4-cresol dehydrogenase (hydroxylating)
MGETAPESLYNALAALRLVLGAEHVVETPEALDRAARTTFASEVRPRAIVRPGSCSDVQECLRRFHEAHVRVHPVSRGCNWGLGSRVPPADGSVLMDLSRLDRIIAIDETLGTLTLEPGVTFQQACDALRQRGSRFFLSTTGSSPEASVIGNALERGDGSGPNSDHFAAACALEVVLPTGECIHTGFERFGDNPVARLHRWGVGPHLDGLFSQGRFGVVTRMTVFLSRLPRVLGVIRFSIRRQGQLVALVDAIRELRLDGTLSAPVGLWNDYRVVSARRQYPWEQSDAAPPLSRDALYRAAGARLDAWYGALAIYAPSRLQARADARHVRGLLGPVVDTLAVEEHVGTGKSQSGDLADPAVRFFRGVPHRESLRSVYWRRKIPVPHDPDPDRDACGVLWACPTVPLVGHDVTRATSEAERLMFEHGFEPMLAVIATTARTGMLIPLVVYDREVAGADGRAMACHDAVLSRMIELGFLPSRLGNQSMGMLPEPGDASRRLLRALAAALDPHDILGPGRYRD